MSINVDTAPLLALIGAMVLFAGPRVKQLIDLIGMGVNLPRWAPPALAYALGVLSCIGLATALRLPLPMDVILIAALFSGIQVAIDAVAITEMQNKRNDASRAMKREVDHAAAP